MCAKKEPSEDGSRDGSVCGNAQAVGLSFEGGVAAAGRTLLRVAEEGGDGLVGGHLILLDDVDVGVLSQCRLGEGVGDVGRGRVDVAVVDWVGVRRRR